MATASNTDALAPSNHNTWTYTYNKRRLLESESLAYNNRTFNTVRHSETCCNPERLKA